MARDARRRVFARETAGAETHRRRPASLSEAPSRRRATTSRGVGGGGFPCEEGRVARVGFFGNTRVFFRQHAATCRLGPTVVAPRDPFHAAPGTPTPAARHSTQTRRRHGTRLARTRDRPASSSRRLPLPGAFAGRANPSSIRGFARVRVGEKPPSASPPPRHAAAGSPRASSRSRSAPGGRSSASRSSLADLGARPGVDARANARYPARARRWRSAIAPGVAFSIALALAPLPSRLPNPGRLTSSPRRDADAPDPPSATTPPPRRPRSSLSRLRRLSSGEAMTPRARSRIRARPPVPPPGPDPGRPRPLRPRPPPRTRTRDPPSTSRTSPTPPPTTAGASFARRRTSASWRCARQWTRCATR